MEKGLKVLSLFDGMSCGQIALERSGIKVAKYYASEIKPHAIKVTKHNYPDTIHIGDVMKISYKDGVLYTENGDFECGQIDLLIGGSPCQDLSAMNKNQVGLKGLKSSLFWEYVRIKEEVNPTYFMLENVGSAPNEDLKIITKTLGVDGVRINSSLVSAQMRDRIYWTNIPGTGIDLFGNRYIEQPKDKGVLLKDILENAYTDLDKAGCLLAGRCLGDKPDLMTNYVKRRLLGGMSRSSITFCYTNKELDIDKGIRRYTQTEYERIQTIPVGYTSCLSYNQATNVLGDGWTVDVICHLFQGLKNIA